jgi:hypothetical protein
MTKHWLYADCFIFGLVRVRIVARDSDGGFIVACVSDVPHTTAYPRGSQLHVSRGALVYKVPHRGPRIWVRTVTDGELAQHLPAGVTL